LEHSIEQDLVIADLRDALRKSQRALVLAKDKQAAVTQAAFEGARDAMLGMDRPKVPKPRLRHNNGTGKPEHALWHLTDWQGAKKTTTYNTEVMRQRVHQFVDTAESITAIHRSDHPVNDCTIMLGGDMIEGLFNFPTQPYEVDATLFDQFVNVATLLDEVARRAASIYDNVTIIGEAGNHGRLGSKRDAVPRSDNADRMTYRLAAAMTKDEPRITWQDSPEDIQRVEIGNYRALLIHGDEFGRGGFASPMTIVRHCDRWRSGAYAWDFRDVYVGHYHNHAEWAMANGEGSVYQTGSTESDNRYARDSMSASAIPSQRLHFVEPVKGRVTAQYKITLANKASLGVEKVTGG